MVPDSIDRLSQEIHSQWRASEVRADAGEFQSPDYLAIVHSVFEVEGIELSDSQVATLWELSNAGTSFLGCRLFEDAIDFFFAFSSPRKKRKPQFTFQKNRFI